MSKYKFLTAKTKNKLYLCSLYEAKNTYSILPKHDLYWSRVFYENKNIK